VDGEIELCVQDDGAGLPEKVDEGRPASLGLRLILILAEQLQGTIHIRRRPGTTITVTVPANHERQRTANHVT